jgi:hypothetical protein
MGSYTTDRRVGCCHGVPDLQGANDGIPRAQSAAFIVKVGENGVPQLNWPGFTFRLTLGLGLA